MTTLLDDRPPFFPAIPLDLVLEHPLNPRRNATADDSMVDSIRAQGVLEPGITEAKQIEAMIVENGHREDLSPIEEAEGYHQLELLGYKATTIATAVGRDAKTIRGRLKLLKLTKPTQTKVHAGDLTLDDALGLVEFADDPDATKRLEEAASSSNLRWKLEEERRRRSNVRTAAAEQADLLALGATDLTVPTSTDLYTWVAETHDLAHLYSTHSDDPKKHKGCLGVVVTDGSYPRVIALCTKASKHNAQRSKADQVVIAEREAADAEQKAERDAVAAARTVRLASITAGPGNATLPKILADVARGLVPVAVRSLVEEEVVSYCDLMGLEPGQRWKAYGSSKANRQAYADHVDDITNGSHAYVTKALVAVLAARTEAIAGNQYAHDSYAPALRAYLATLDAIGHPFSDPDIALRTKITDTKDADA